MALHNVCAVACGHNHLHLHRWIERQPRKFLGPFGRSKLSSSTQPGKDLGNCRHTSVSSFPVAVAPTAPARSRVVIGHDRGCGGQAMLCVSSVEFEAELVTKQSIASSERDVSGKVR